jgi:hypothetical protein
VHERARKLHELGFGPDCGTPEFGFGIYPLAQGRILQRDDLSRDLLSHMARYCAVRGREFPATDGHAAHSKMEEMARFNFQEEFGDSLPPLDLPDGALASRSPIISDARMQPHEWFCTDDGRVLKLDGAEHGDDHFFPGPTDIAWDLAGAIVEWKLSPEATDTLVREYRRVSGDRVEQRVPAFVAAYASFRMGYCKMAAEAVRGSGEEHRLLRAYERYRDYLAAIASPQRAAVAAAQNANAVDARDADNSRAAEHAPSIFEGPTAEPLAA